MIAQQKVVIRLLMKDGKTQINLLLGRFFVVGRVIVSRSYRSVTKL